MFQKKIWLSLDKDVQAALILHETIYEHMISVGELPSRSTRYLNAALHAGHLETVREYFEVSSLFAFRNLNIVIDGRYRFYGKKNLCKVKTEWPSGGEVMRGGTTIMVGRQNIVTLEENFNTAMNLFWNKYVSQGSCD